jgi:uncharacterized sulfatase
VPAIVRWPGTVEPGTIVEHTVTNLDWYPTLVALGQADLPEGETIRGRNIVPLLKGESVDWNDDLYAEYSTHHQSRTHMRAFRTPRWKLVRDFLNPGRDELYDLEKDPAERVNLIDAESVEIQRTIAELHEKIIAHMRLVRDPVLETIDAK